MLPMVEDRLNKLREDLKDQKTKELHRNKKKEYAKRKKHKTKEIRRPGEFDSQFSEGLHQHGCGRMFHALKNAENLGPSILK